MPRPFNRNDILPEPLQILRQELSKAYQRTGLSADQKTAEINAVKAKIKTAIEEQRTAKGSAGASTGAVSTKELPRNNTPAGRQVERDPKKFGWSTKGAPWMPSAKGQQGTPLPKDDAVFAKARTKLAEDQANLAALKKAIDSGQYIPGLAKGYRKPASQLLGHMSERRSAMLAEIELIKQPTSADLEALNKQNSYVDNKFKALTAGLKKPDLDKLMAMIATIKNETLVANTKPAGPAAIGAGESPVTTTSIPPEEPVRMASAKIEPGSAGNVAEPAAAPNPAIITPEKQAVARGAIQTSAPAKPKSTKPVEAPVLTVAKKAEKLLTVIEDLMRGVKKEELGYAAGLIDGAVSSLDSARKNNDPKLYGQAEQAIIMLVQMGASKIGTEQYSKLVKLSKDISPEIHKAFINIADIVKSAEAARVAKGGSTADPQIAALPPKQ
jgi:hypothetical protein